MSGLEEWTDVVCEALGLEAVEQTRAREVVLDLARDVAHGVARPAAPVTAFLLGLAVGRSGGAIDDVAARIRALIPPPAPDAAP